MRKHRDENENARHGKHPEHQPRHGSSSRDNQNENPPRTTSHGWTTPKFGASTSGGGEIEPGPERD